MELAIGGAGQDTKVWYRLLRSNMHKTRCVSARLPRNALKKAKKLAVFWTRTRLEIYGEPTPHIFNKLNYAVMVFMDWANTFSGQDTTSSVKHARNSCSQVINLAIIRASDITLGNCRCHQRFIVIGARKRQKSSVFNFWCSHWWFSMT